MTQQQTLIRALKRRAFTSLEAAETLGVWALSQRCSELIREGVKVRKQWVTTQTGKRVMRYSIPR